MGNSLIMEMNDKLKTIKTWGELNDLREEYNQKVMFTLRLKRNNRCKHTYPLNGDWAKCLDYRLQREVTQEEQRNDSKMTYIVDGDDRVRECMVCNLWKYVEFVEW